MSETRVQGTSDVLFVRSATGLLREVRQTDQWIFNALMLNLGLAGVYLFEFGPWARPGGNLFLITIIGTIGFACVAATYALLSSAFPRTGGDYVFNTRVLGGGVGFWSSWMVFVVFASIGGASVAWFFAHSGIPFALSLVARVSSSETIQSWATASAGTGWTTVTATGLILLSALALIQGLGFLMRIQRWLFIAGSLGLLLVIGLLVLTSSGEFAARYDAVAGAGAYDAVLSVGEEQGLGSGWSWGATLSLFPIIAVPALFAVATNWFAGELQEVRSPRKTVVSMVSVVVVFGLLMLALTTLLYHSVGERFLEAINFMFFSGVTDGYGFASDPNYFAIASVATDSLPILGLIAIGWLAWTIMWTPGNMLWAIRILFAWSFDRLAPEAVSEVNRRTNTPVRATIIVAILVEAFLLMAQYIEKMLTFFVAASFMVNVGMTITCAAGALFPYLKPELFERSPANMRWRGVPVITIVGTVATVVMVITDIQFLTVKELFVNTKEMWWYAGGSAALGVVLYFVIRMTRKGQGTDLSLTFAEIPPE